MYYEFWNSAILCKMFQIKQELQILLEAANSSRSCKLYYVGDVKSSRIFKKISELQTTLLAAKRRRLWLSVCHQLTQGGGQDISYHLLRTLNIILLAKNSAKRENQCFFLILIIPISRHSTIDHYHYPIHPRGLSSCCSVLAYMI